MFLILIVINTIFTIITTDLTIWLANLPLSVRDHTMLLVSMCHTMPFSARTLKKNISLAFIFVVKKNRNACYQQWVCAKTLFPNIVFVLFLHVEQISRWNLKVWHIQVSQLHSTAPALSSPNFQMSTNHDRDFFLNY